MPASVGKALRGSEAGAMPGAIEDLPARDIIEKGSSLMRSVLVRCRSVARHAWRLVAIAAGCGVITVLAVGQLGISPAAAQPVLLGLDVSGHQPSINWSAVASAGAQFAYVKATEGTGFVNPDFAAQYDGAYQAGLIRGAYHFALPNDSSGAAQASYFVANGGGWSADGRTLPGALDIEYNPYGAECYGLSQSAMVSWITSFNDTYETLTSVWPVIYTTTAWWAKCTGNYGGFAGEDPLWIASYDGGAGALPAGWSTYTFWQYASAGTLPGDQDTFNGSNSQLLEIAYG
jgi:GH25 family lysozyme M1 (1,4-beta-N-acetylmuramidase)